MQRLQVAVNSFKQRETVDFSVIAVLLINFTWTIPWGLVDPFISPYFFVISQGDYFLTGLLRGIPFLSIVFSVFIFGWLVDKFGSKVILSVAFTFMLTLFLTLLVITDPLLFFIDYVILNGLLACFSPAVNKYASLTQRKNIFGAMGASASFGYFLGASLSGFLFDIFGMSMMFLFAVGTCFLGLFLSFIIPAQKEESNKHKEFINDSQPISDVLKDSKLLYVLFVVAFMQMVHTGIAGTFSSLYFLDELLLPAQWLGLNYGLATLAGTFLSSLVGRIGESNNRANYKRILILFDLAYAIVWGIFFFAQDYIIPFLVFLFPLYVGLFVAGPALVTSAVPEARRGTFMGIFGAVQNLGLGLGVILGGYWGGLQGSLQFNFGIASLIACVVTLVTVLFLNTSQSSEMT